MPSRPTFTAGRVLFLLLIFPLTALSVGVSASIADGQAAPLLWPHTADGALIVTVSPGPTSRGDWRRWR